MKEIQRRTWAEINLDTIEENFNHVKSLTKAQICCVVKADAYGHGATFLAKKYEELGADFFAVSNIEEAIQLRRSDIKTPILVLGYTPVVDVEILAENNISQCVYSIDYAKALSKAADENDVSVNIHVKVDTGMSRLGFYYQDLGDDKALKEIVEVCHLKNLVPEGIFTHFAVSDEGEKGNIFTMSQYGYFKELVESLLMEDIYFPYKHCANSAAIEDFPMSHLDMVRAGIILYGLEPSEKIRHGGKIKPAMELKSIVSHVKTINKGATVSYGRAFTAEKEMRIATVPIGYADGYSRIFSTRGGEILISGKRCKILGRICMDQLMVDISHVENVKIGDVVTIIGKDGDEFVGADELAKLRDTINYEIVCDIGARVPRVYLQNGKEVETQNYICP